jgi:hypothetical protein
LAFILLPGRRQHGRGPGFARGWRGYALVGTSLPRDGAFKGLELEDNVKARDGKPRCGADIVDTRTGDILHWIRFEGPVRELFDATFIPRGQGAHVRRPR